MRVKTHLARLAAVPDVDTGQVVVAGPARTPSF
jgi:hypothetical protein